MEKINQLYLYLFLYHTWSIIVHCLRWVGLLVVPNIIQITFGTGAHGIAERNLAARVGLGWGAETGDKGDPIGKSQPSRCQAVWQWKNGPYRLLTNEQERLLEGCNRIYHRLQDCEILLVASIAHRWRLAGVHVSQCIGCFGDARPTIFLYFKKVVFM